MAHWSDDYRQMIADCEARESQLSEWEAGFVASITERLDRDRILSAKQIETLERIWDKATRNG